MPNDTAQRRQYVGDIVIGPGGRPEPCVLTAVERPTVEQYRTWTTKCKTEIETRASSATVADDAHLTIPVLPLWHYVIRGQIFFDTNATADFKFAITGPTSPTEVLIRGHHKAVGETADTDFAFTTFGTEEPVTGTGGTTGGYVEFNIKLETGANGGNVTVQWAQNTSDAGDTSVLVGSLIEFIPVVPV